MAKETLEEYPNLVDPFLDFEVTKEHFGMGSCNYGIGERKLNSGKVVVYLNQQREGELIGDTSRGFGRVCEQGIVVCGYKAKPWGIFGFLRLPKIKPIPADERQGVGLELVDLFKKTGREEPAYLDFWPSSD